MVDHMVETAAATLTSNMLHALPDGPKVVIRMPIATTMDLAWRAHLCCFCFLLLETLTGSFYLFL